MKLLALLWILSPSVSVALILLVMVMGLTTLILEHQILITLTNLSSVAFQVTGLSLLDNSIVIVDTGADPDSVVVEEAINNETMDLIVGQISTTTYCC